MKENLTDQLAYMDINEQGMVRSGKMNEKRSITILTTKTRLLLRVKNLDPIGLNTERKN